MLTKILFATIFAVAGWFLSDIHPLYTTEPWFFHNGISAFFSIALGYIVVGDILAKFLAGCLPCKYKEQEKHPLHTFLFSEETLLIKESKGNIIFSTGGEIMFAKREDVLPIRILEGEDPYWSICLPVRASFGGLFADFSKFKHKWIFVVPHSNLLIDDGYIVSVNHR